MKKTKIIVPALGLLLLSTAASVTGTVAWFSMNSEVTATGMQVKAKAENGIVISNEEKSSWTDSATASHNGSGVELVPTSTVNGKNWYHASSTNADDAAANQDAAKYTEIVATVTDGVGVKDSNNYYLVNSFYISSSSAQALTKDLFVKSLTASIDGTTQSGDLDKSVRVLISDAAGDNAIIFNPLSGTASYKVAGATDVTTQTGAAEVKLLSNTSIPAYTGNSGLEIKVFAYFEGEDANCKSTNIKATLDSINVEFKLEAKDVA